MRSLSALGVNCVLIRTLVFCFDTADGRHIDQPRQEVAACVCEAGVVDSEHIHFDAYRYQGDDRMHVLRDGGSGVAPKRKPMGSEACADQGMRRIQVIRYSAILDKAAL
jgi:hypothetical protein